MKNYLKYSLWLVLTVFVALFGASLASGYNDRRTHDEARRYPG